ncbi:MAG: RluA family pseudouridine synthase [Bacteriovoracaceae bacterium]|nr:RluA family pseudouridine synthase [Bacteriovoracaceae bacterium]
MNSDSSESSDDIDLIELTITPQDTIAFRRLDQMLARKLPQLSRSFIKKIFTEGLISFSHPSFDEIKKMPPAGTVITIHIPPPPPPDAKPQNIPLEILFQDKYLVIVNKPAGLVTHPGAGNYDGTLVNAILYHCPDMIAEGKRPGIVHRLDKGTSGVMVIAKIRECHEELVTLFAKREIERYYEALVIGTKINPQGRLESFIGRHPNNRLKMATHSSLGKYAVTHYKVLDFFENFSHLELKLETGRTHQIRVHMESLLHHPILCDTLYGNPAEQMKRLPSAIREILSQYPHPLLHAKTLGFIHPMTKERICFTVPAPKPFSEILKIAKGAL